MKPSEELIKLARQRYFMEVIDTITHKDLMQLATKIAQLEAKIMLYRKAYEQAVEIAWQGESVRLPDLDDMIIWLEEKETMESSE